MVRTVKPPDVRRNEIVDVVQALFTSKGYDNTSVQDILDGAGIAKGTFYHYFDSKVALLDALVARLTDATLRMVEPIVHDPQMTALEKLPRLSAPSCNGRRRIVAFSWTWSA